MNDSQVAQLFLLLYSVMWLQETTKNKGHNYNFSFNNQNRVIFPYQTSKTSIKWTLFNPQYLYYVCKNNCLLLLKRVCFRNSQHILPNEKRINTGLLLPPNSRKIQKTLKFLCHLWRLNYKVTGHLLKGESMS